MPCRGHDLAVLTHNRLVEAFESKAKAKAAVSASEMLKWGAVS